jgi:hypothetical protein
VLAALFAATLVAWGYQRWSGGVAQSLAEHRWGFTPPSCLHCSYVAACDALVTCFACVACVACIVCIINWCPRSCRPP